MPTIKCELCGSNELIKYDGMYVCNKCRCNYTPEEAKKLVIHDEVNISYENKAPSQNNKQQTSLVEERKKTNQQTSLARSVLENKPPKKKQ